MNGPIIKPISKTMMVLVEDFKFKAPFALVLDDDALMKELSETDHITIKAGFEFDGASIPQLFHSLIGSPFTPAYIEAALIHDFCCVNDLDGWVRDEMFKDNLRDNGVSAIKSGAMYKAVVAYRWFARTF